MQLLYEVARAELIQEGYKEGFLKGRQEVRAEMFLNFLRSKFGSVPKKRAEQVRAASEAQLNVWQKRFHSAPSLEAVFSGNGDGELNV